MTELCASTSGTIYGLFDPRTEALRYVGMTRIGIDKRLRKHLHSAENKEESHRSNWIRKLSDADLVPEIDALEGTVPPEDLPLNEEAWIEFALTAGHPLTNMTDGGEGGGTPSSSSKNHKPGCKCVCCTRTGGFGNKYHAPDCTCFVCARTGGFGNKYHKPGCTCCGCTPRTGDANPAKRPEVRAKMREGSHRRWHVARNKPNPECEFCQEEVRS